MGKFIDDFQIAGLAFFLIVFGGRTLHLRFSKNINPIKLGVGKRGLQRVVELSFFAGLVVWIVDVLWHALHTEFRHFPAPFDVRLIDALPARLIGVASVIIGFAIFLWALLSFRDSWRIGIDETTRGALVTTGLFALSRNPIFVFMDIYFIGTFLMNGTLTFLIFAALAAIGLHYQIIQEESFLAKAYGQIYKDYCARTGRYFGRHCRGK